MRLIALLTLTLMGGAAGLFAGGYGYNLSHPIGIAPGGSGAGTPDGNLQAAHRGVADALERHAGRQNWLIGGTILGAGIGFVGTVLASRVVHAEGHRGRPGSDTTA